MFNKIGQRMELSGVKSDRKVPERLSQFLV